ncbi:MAG TPA: hypothetical protein VFC53_12490 [Dehalococcoidia bacterium]|nr:hypothetical protein [Dehalococcoidia bacterium]
MRITARASALSVLALVAVALAACGGGGHGRSDAKGPPRDFMMGFSTVPRALNADAYAEAFKTASEHGEMVLIQRTPPWADFLPDATISDETARTTASEKQALADHKLRLFFAIDPTDGATGRDRLADLPPQLAGKRFDDPDVRAAFVSYAKYVALNYKPAVLALGVEMNLYYEHDHEDFENFRTLYGEAYDAVKAIAPDTQVTVTYQYEDLQGLLPTQDKHFADWQLVKAFDPKLDLMAISTYPSFAFPAASAIPDNYYTQLQAFTDRPIAIAEMGYASDAGPQGVNSGTETDQAAYLRRALGDAERMHMPFVIWFACWDPTFARASGAYGVYQHIGLLRDDNSEKPAWSVWADAARRPYR